MKEILYDNHAKTYKLTVTNRNTDLFHLDNPKLPKRISISVNVKGNEGAWTLPVTLPHVQGSVEQMSRERQTNDKNIRGGVSI